MGPAFSFSLPFLLSYSLWTRFMLVQNELKNYQLTNERKIQNNINELLQKLKWTL